MKALLVAVALTAAAAITTNDDEQCGLYLARSTIEPETLSLYAGIDYNAFDQVGDQDLVLPIVDANKNEFSPWHDFTWANDILPEELMPKSRYFLDIILAGIGTMSTCSTQPNIHRNDKVFLGSHVYGDDYAASGSVSDYHNYDFQAVTPLEAGEMLFVACNEDEDEAFSGEKVSLDDLQNYGACVDTLQVRDSTLHGAGRGAFAKRYTAKGGVVATTPLIHMDRSQTEIVKQEYKEVHRIPQPREHGIEYTSEVVGQQLMLNYCYGHPDSNVLLFPFGPGVNFINHNEAPNAYIRWSTFFPDSQHLRETMPVMELFEMAAGPLAMEIIALKDIVPGDEIFIDYGEGFKEAWKKRIHSGGLSEQPFRHEIGVPDGFYPDNWMRADPRPYGDFIPSPLAYGQMAPIRWSSTAKVVTPWAFRLGLGSRVREVLLEYCNKMGITDILKHVTKEGNELEPGKETHMELEGDDWYLQRPEPKWRSNMHWFSPGAGPAHDHYLQALSVAGFDGILNSIAGYLGMDGLVVFHVTFIGVSVSNRGFMHHDVTETDAKVYNIIIPLIVANETGPELDVESYDPDRSADVQDGRVGRYRYEYDVASMMGDDAYHATSACDYRKNKEMRLAATVYIADVNDANAEYILNHYTQAYPPPDIDLLKNWTARHWKKGDPSRKLPKPLSDHIMVRADWETARKREVAPEPSFTVGARMEDSLSPSEEEL
jgi:hypothetical protein